VFATQSVEFAWSGGVGGFHFGWSNVVVVVVVVVVLS